MAESEIWKALPGVTGVEVSTFGNVRTLDRVTSGEKRTRFTKGRILKQFKDAKNYLKTNIPISGKWITKRVHRLVAQTFIPNPNNLPQVNHKNCNRADNRVSNLEWCSNSYNQKYRNKFGISQAEKTGHPLFAVNLATNEVLHFRSQGEASRELELFQQNINKVIKGKYKQTGGFWFVNDDENVIDAIKQKLYEIKHQTVK